MWDTCIMWCGTQQRRRWAANLAFAVCNIKLVGLLVQCGVAPQNLVCAQHMLYFTMRVEV